MKVIAIEEDPTLIKTIGVKYKYMVGALYFLNGLMLHRLFRKKNGEDKKTKGSTL